MKHAKPLKFALIVLAFIVVGLAVTATQSRISDTGVSSGSEINATELNSIHFVQVANGSDIQTALNSCPTYATYTACVVILPSGHEYTITNQIDVPMYAQIWGTYNSYVKADAAFADSVMFNVTGNNIFRDFRVGGNNVANGFLTENPDGDKNVWENIDIVNTVEYGIKITPNSYYNRIQNLKTYFGAIGSQIGVWIQGNSNTIAGGKINGNEAIRIDGANTITVLNAAIESGGTTGVNITNSSGNIDLIGNRYESWTDGIAIENSSGVRVIGGGFYTIGSNAVKFDTESSNILRLNQDINFYGMGKIINVTEITFNESGALEDGSVTINDMAIPDGSIDDSNLILYLPFSNNFMDYAIYQPDTTASSISLVDGKVGNAANFTGASPSLLIGSSADQVYNITGDYSASMWFKPRNTNIAVLIGGDNTIGNSLFIYYGAGNELNVVINNGTHKIGTTPQVTNVFNVGEWNHIGLIYDASTYTLTTMINGIVEDSSVQANASQALDFQGLVVGNSHNGGTSYELNGYLDEVKLWNITLSTDDLLQEYHNIAPSFSTGAFLKKSVGYTGACADGTSLTVVNGQITACS